MSLQRVRAAIQFLRKKAGLDEQLSEVRLVTDGRSIYSILQSEGELMDALKEGQLAFFLAIDDAVARTDARSAQYLYDRDELVSTLRRIGSTLEEQLDPAARGRLRSAVSG